MAVATTAPEEQVVLHGIRWETYERLRDEIENRLRLTYDRGTLEIMTVSPRHEWWNALLGRLVDAMTEELGIPVRSGGGPTWKRRHLERGLEPDKCYWVQHESRVRGRADLDPAVDPPPDLALETEVSRSALDRLSIYEALGVPEVWRFDGERLTVHVMDDDGRYVESPTSRCFPWLPLAQFAGFLGRTDETDETTWIRSFRDWVRTACRLA